MSEQMDKNEFLQQQLELLVSKKTDPNIEWQDVADFRTEYYNMFEHRDTVRKGSKMLYEYIDAGWNIVPPSIVDLGMSTEKLALQKERIKIQTEKLELNKWIRELARDEMIAEKLIVAINDLAPLEIPEKIGVPYNDKGYLLAFGDLHYAVDFKIKGLFGEILNEYSPEICEKRMWTLYNKVCSIVDKENIGTLHVVNLSDNLDGILRISQLMKLRYGVVDATIKVSELLANWLNELSKKVKIKYYMVMDSNHDELRILDGKKGSFSEDNMDKIILAFIKERLKNNPNIEIIENNTNMVFMNICGYNIAAIHGEVKDMESALREYSSIYGVNINYLLAGHLHHRKQEEIGFDTSVINIGSIVGVDSYSLKLRKASNPSAKILCFEEKGDIAVEYNIKLK